MNLLLTIASFIVAKNVFGVFVFTRLASGGRCWGNKLELIFCQRVFGCILYDIGTIGSEGARGVQ